MIHVNRSGASLGIFEEEKVREGLGTGEFIETDLGWMDGMPTWRPLSELETFRTLPAPPIPPLVATELGIQSATPEVAAAPVTARTGLPWENRERLGLFNALVETVTMMFTRPEQAFSIMKRDAGFTDPLLYAVLLGTVGALISIGFSLILKSIGIAAGDHNGMSALLGFGFASVFLIILIPIFLVIGTFIGGAITHLCLMIVGGANQSFETTVRVLCYGSGSANVFQIVPFCGGILACLAGLALNCIGLARAHETDTWRAVLAVLLPLIVCCGSGALLFFAIIGGMAANWH